MRRLVLLVLTFVISHLAYVGDSSFAKEVDDDQPIGATGGTVHVDPFTGTATTSIPIHVFPGRNAVQPNLQLTYASSNGNGWVGMGWKLELGAIERNSRFGVMYDESPSNNGKVYAVRMSGVSAELIKLDPNNPTDLNYRAKVEGGFFRIRKLTTGGWEVTDRKGVKYLFGTSANARVEHPTDATKVFRWNLERIEDRDGNYMLVTYTKDQGQAYLSQIDYTYTTKDATPASLSIKFYSNVPAGMIAPDTYNAYFKIVTAKRLQAIEVKANGVTMRVYKLSYAPSATTGSYLLSQVQQFNRNAAIDPVTYNVTGTALPPVTMTYTTSAQTFTPSTWDWLTGWCGGGTQVNPGDLNGDGRQDLWCFNPNGGISGTRAETNTTLTNTGTGVTGCTSIGVGDFNGDGRQDAACYDNYYNPAGCVGRSFECIQQQLARLTRVKVGVSDANGVFAPATTWIDSGWCDNTGTVGLGVLDIDGDGRSDIWCRGVSIFNGGALSLSFLRSMENNTFSVIGTTSTTCTTSMGGGDFNGDGKSDLWCHDAAGTTSVSYSTSTATAASFTGFSTVLTGWCNSGPPGGGGRSAQNIFWLYGGSVTGKFSVADFNGDGLQDLWCQFTDGTIKVALSVGTSFTAPSVWRTGWCSSGTTGVADVNGDGVSDLWCHTSDGSTQIALSTGSTFSTPTSWSSGFCPTATFGTADLDGDGKADLWCFNSGVVSVALAGSPGIKTDLLASVSNGIGASTVLSYTPSTQLGPTHTLLPYPVYVTTKLTNTVTTSLAGGTGNQVTDTTYQFEKGYHSLSNRDFRGFQRATVTACANCSATEQTVTVTEFHQGSGTVAVEDTGATLTDPDAPTKGLPYVIYVYGNNGLTLLLDTVTTYMTDADAQAPWFTPSAQVKTRTYANGVTAKNTQVNFTYDSTYGNVIREEHHGEVALTGDEKTIERDFANETTGWLIGFPKRETIYRGISTAAQDKVAETTFFYDGVTNCATASTLQVPTLGHLTRTVNWLNGGTNPETRMAYDQYGNKVCARDPKGNVTTLTYDPTRTFPLTTTNALGHLTTTSYYGVNSVVMDTGLYGQAKSVTDPNGRMGFSTYDAFGRGLTTTTPDTPAALVSTKVYNYGGTFVVGTQHIQTTISGGGVSPNLVSKTYFDGLGRVIKKENPGAADGGATLKVLVTETHYDSRGLVKQTSLPYIQGIESATGRWSTMTYDALGRLIQSTNPDNTSSRVCYSGWTTTTLDPKLHKKVETKDAFGRLITVQEYTGQATVGTCAGGTLYATTTYAYDRLGNLLSATDAKGNVSTMTYDTLGRKLTMHDPDMGNWSYTYDANGNLLTQVDAKTKKLCFSYDALNRRTQKNYGTTTVACGTNTVVYTYDDTVTTYNRKGRLKQVTDPAQNVTFQYDSRGRITQSAKILDGTTYTTTSAYDGLGRLTSVSYPTSPIKTITYTYDGPQLKRVSEGATNYVTYAGWNALGQSATATFANGVVTTSTYANTNNTTCTQQTFRLCTLKIQKGANPLYQNLRYDYEANGNVWNIYDATVASNAGDQHFSYDDLDRLTIVNGPYGASGANTTYTYSYNEIGNMTVNPQVGTFSYPASGPSSVRPHAVSVAGPYPITYDNNGNVIGMTDPTGFYGYAVSHDVENHPTTITTTYGGVPTTATFVYDGDGGRVKKVVGTTTTRYISKLYECDTTGATTSCSRFIWAGSTRIATVASNGTVHYWHGDHLGSSSVITDSTGAKVQAITYFPFGDIRTNQSFTTPAVNVPYKYTGKELDANSNLYFYESRYYHPVFGRFVSPDTIVPNPHDPQSLNRYTYANNNPLMYTDPTGHFGIIEVIIIGIVIGTVTSGIQSDWDIGATLTGGIIGGVTAGAGFGVGSSVAAATLSSLGSVGSGIAGGVVGGAVAGGTSGVLANLAGYKVNIGLSIASGAAAGGIVGGAGAQWGQLGAFAAAPAAGASAAAISGADPGMGAAIAATAAAFSLGVQAYDQYRQQAITQAQEANPTYALNSDQASIASPALDPGGVTGGCYGICKGISAFWQFRQNTAPNTAGVNDPYNFNVIISNPQGARLDVGLLTPFTTTNLGSFQDQGIIIPKVNLSLQYRSDIVIQVYGQHGIPSGLYDLPFEYGKTTPLPYK